MPLEGLPGELPEMRWYDGRFPRSIRVDAPLVADAGWGAHAHIFDADGTERLIVNRDGSARRGMGGALDPADAAILAALGFAIPVDGRVR